MKKEMLINVLQPEECRIAIIEDGVLEELYVERTSHESFTGNIYKGRIVNLEPAIQAAFVDFSVGRNGFLHVSDVEPSYYRKFISDDAELGGRDRNRDSRRERDEPRPRPAPEGRAPRPAAPPPAPGDPPRRPDRERPDRERPDRERPDRERPDRSEKGRRDRSEPRRFGEGLADDIEEDWVAPPSAAEPAPAPVPPPESEAAPVPPRAARPESPRTRPETSRNERPARPESMWGERPPSRPENLWGEPPPSAPESPWGEPPPARRSAEIEEPRARGGRARDAEPPAGEHSIGWGSRDLPPEPPQSASPPSRGRGRHRPPAPVTESETELAFEPAEESPTRPVEPLERPLDEPLRPRAGRAAIRSRGGERQPERPREPVERPRESVERPREPVEPPRAFLPTERPIEPEPERPRGRHREPARPVDPDAPREAFRPHARAGEPGYVPRRERSRFEEPAIPGSSEGVPEAEARPEVLPLDEAAGPDRAGAEPGTEADRTHGPKRRRRRRGRRREGTERESDTERSAAPREELTELHVPLGLDDELENFRGHEDDLEFDEPPALADDEDEEESGGDEIAVTSPEDQIDPELEEEIRKEVEEITELEREMGLRGPIEARPRPGEPAEGGRGPRAPRGRGPAKPPIQEVFRRGDEVLVQVIKESIGTKGPTLSTYISIPGRYLVLMPGLNRVGVSRKIADESQRRKLREIMNELNPPRGLGFIVRTAGLERSKRELARDLAYLLRLWKVILRRIKKTRAPAPIYQESDMIIRTIRDIFTSEIDTIWIDEPAAFERAQEFLRVVMPRYVNRLKFYEEKVPLFHKYGIEEEIAKIQRRQIPLPEGGSIVIDQTEALVAIDVNSGNFRVENDAERTAYEMNIRAAKEIARQLRLRDLGGVIVNDFIDMRDERNRRGVERALREAVRRDRARTKILRMSQFGLIEMTRQRIRPSLRRSVYEDCGHCTGTGVAKTAESMAIDVMRLLALAGHREDIRRVNVSVCAPVSNYLNNRKRREVARLESEANMTIHIRHEDDAPAEHLQIDCFDTQNNEVRLLPAPPPPHTRRGR